MVRQNDIGMCGRFELKGYNLGWRTTMRKLVLLFIITLLAACTVEVGKVKPERKALYDHNNNKEFCEKNPNKCVNGIPWM